MSVSGQVEPLAEQVQRVSVGLSASVDQAVSDIGAVRFLISAARDKGANEGNR
jgi:hypothetical protein